MARLFSGRHRFRTWRRMWICLAENQAALGLPISERQLAALREHADDLPGAGGTARTRNAPRCGGPPATLRRSQRRRRQHSSPGRDVRVHHRQHGRADHPGGPRPGRGQADGHSRRAGQLRPQGARNDRARLHPLPVGPVDDTGQARLPLAAGLPHRPRRSGQSPRPAALPWRQGHHRHAGLLPDPVRRRPRQGPRTRRPGVHGAGLRLELADHRPDLPAQAGQSGPARTVRSRGELPQVRQRPAAAAGVGELS